MYHTSVLSGTGLAWRIETSKGGMWIEGLI